MKKRLQPKCQDFKQQLLERAEKQLSEAWAIYNRCEETHTYTVSVSDGSQEQYNDCISAYGIVVRFDGNNRLVYHYEKEIWCPITSYRGLIDSLCEVADHLLNRAYALQKQKSYDFNS